jgi:hypothetical protein
MVVDERRMLRTIQVIAWYVRAGGPRGHKKPNGGLQLLLPASSRSQAC